MKSLKYKATKDPISGQTIGAFICPNCVDPSSGTRSHTGVAYYEPVSSRPNLHLKENARVEKINLSKATDGTIVATGVRYQINGESKVSYAKREVILSSGAFGSPAILELSGVGEQKLRSSLGIEVVISKSNVGENLQDHPMSLLSAEVVDENDSLDSLRDPKKLGEAIRLYTEQQTGPLATGFNSVAFLPVLNLLGPEDRKLLEGAIREHVDNKLQGLSNAQKIQANHVKSIIMDANDSTCLLTAAPVELFPNLSLQGINSISL
jgi:choline dehydrogenase-like flavoprotein